MIDQPRADLRGLKALVGIMGVLIVLGTALVIGVVIHRLYANHAAPSNFSPPPLPSAGLPAGASVGLAPGEHIAGIAAAGPDVAVWVNGPAGDRVLVVNPATGQASVALSGGR